MEMAYATGPAQEFASKLQRGADGKLLRVDSGHLSYITDMMKQQTTVLDHVKKEARIISALQPPQLQVPQMPGFPGGLPDLKAPGPPPQVSIKDLGKKVIEGVEAQGKKYLVQLPQPPQPPGLPQLPQPPQPPIEIEEWTSVKHKLPVLTKTTGPFGKQICQCKVSDMAEPAASVFQVPPDYKTILG
jgi:hypothetical protein